MTVKGSKQEIFCPGLTKKLVHCQTQDHAKRQEHCPQLQNQNDAFLGLLNLPVRMRNMDPYSRVREEDTSYRNEMLPKTFGHLLQRSCYEWRSEEHYLAGYWAVWRSYPHCEKTRNEMVWAHTKINRSCKDDLIGGRSKEGEGNADRKKRWEDNISV